MSNNNKRISGNYSAINATADPDDNWDVNKYRDEHECEEHWQLRQAFLEKWKDHYPEERLLCLARVFTNIEFMGCRYPAQVMQEIAQLSLEVGRKYREQKKTRLQRTFVSASVAAEDRARGVKRVGGEIVEDKPRSTKIAFIPQGHVVEPQTDDKSDVSDDEGQKNEVTEEEGGKNKVSHENNDKDNANMEENQDPSTNEKKNPDLMDADDYIEEMMKIDCLDVRAFRENMFQSTFGRMVLLIRPWARKLWNIQTSCQVCGVKLTNGFEDKWYSLCINGKVLARATGDTKIEARNNAEIIAWEALRREVVSVLIKEQFIAQGDTRIGVSDVSGRGKTKEDVFGTPVENSVAMKMMKMMGWQGGGLGIDAQGIAEPVRANLQMVDRAGLGSARGGVNLRKAVNSLMQRYIASDTFDLDLVFSSEFTKVERAAMHNCAQKIGLASRSYSEGEDRFLVVKKKLDPFSLARAVIEKGGTTPKYQVFIPATLARNGRNT